MRKENDIYQVNKLEVILVIRKYITDILDKIDSIKETQDPTILDRFYNQVINDDKGMRMMEKTADEYKENCKLTDFVSQKAINKIYKDFVDELKRFDGDDTTAITYLNNLLESPEEYYNDNISMWVIDFKQFETFNLIGCRIEYDLDQTYENDDYEWTNVPHYILTLVGRWQKYYEIELHESYSKDYYVTTCGHCDLRRVRNINITHEVKGRPIFKLPRFIEGHDIRTLKFGEGFSILEEDKHGNQYICINGIFEADYDGGHYWYPQGYVKVNMELFKEPNRRQKDKRPVWLFKGGSGLGKTYLANLIGDSNFNKTIYDTDTNTELPDAITSEIIVLGNRYEFKIEDIKERIPSDYELIIVDFSKDE